MNDKYGFIKDEILPEHYIFGSGQIAADILQPTGQWDDFLPTDEKQNLNGVEPYACASFGTLNCVETLLFRLFKDTDNYSDRYLATITGTAEQHGNSPHFVAEYLRKGGCVLEALWPFGPNINSFSKFYAPIPPNVDGQAHEFMDHFAFRHDWVKNDSASLKSALSYSPLGISVYAWVQGQNGYYIKPAGASDNHWCMLYGYEDGVCWHVFDSYDNTHKKLAWDFTFEQVKRYSIQLAPQAESLLSTLAKALQAALAWLIGQQFHNEATPPVQPSKPPEPPQPKPDLLTPFCKAIEQYEGYAPGTRAYINNNPGNLRTWSTQDGTKGGFAYFATYEKGFAALKELVRRACAGESNVYKPTDTIFQFFSRYAPLSDGNDPVAYSKFVAKQLGVPVETQIKQLLA